LTLEQPDNNSSAAAAYTSNYLIDKLKAVLAKTLGLDNIIYRPWFNDKRVGIYGDRKYYNKAFDLLSIGAYNPVPFFIINLPDLPKSLRNELSNLDKEARAFVLKQAVGRIFEDINPDLFHNSISRVLKVRFEK
jgi:hypothetical protein